MITLTDSYKLSHFNQYPQGTQIIHSYIMPRGGQYDKVLFFGLQYYIQEYINKAITQIDIDNAEKLSIQHGTPFYKEGWEYILKQHNGKLPLIIYAKEENKLYNNKTPLVVIENTDPKCFWLTSYVETLLLKIWYPTTIATKCYYIKKMIESYYDIAQEDKAGLDFAYHNFGDRGSTSVETAAIGGLAHLTQFKGTDNFNCLTFSQKYYNNEFQGFSIPATEHSTVTSWGRENEFNMIENFIETYKSYVLIACVCDSYDIYKTTNFLTSGLIKEKIESNNYPTFVIRPDSGQPIEVITKILDIMHNNNVAFTTNQAGYKLFNKYRILWGDGITEQTIENILLHFISQKISPKNFAFGSGGDLMQNCNRDTLKFAYKCSAAKINGQWVDVYKDPITDKGKTSLKGRIDTNEMKCYYSL